MRPPSLFAASAVCGWLWSVIAPQAPLCLCLRSASLAREGFDQEEHCPQLNIRGLSIWGFNNPAGKSKCNFSSWFCLKYIANWNHFVSKGSLENVSERQGSPLRLILRNDFMFFTFVSIFIKDQVQFLKLPDVLAQLWI